MLIDIDTFRESYKQLRNQKVFLQQAIEMEELEHNINELCDELARTNEDIKFLERFFRLISMNI